MLYSYAIFLCYTHMLYSYSAHMLYSYAVHLLCLYGVFVRSTRMLYSYGCIHMMVTSLQPQCYCRLDVPSASMFFVVAMLINAWRRVKRFYCRLQASLTTASIANKENTIFIYIHIRAKILLNIMLEKQNILIVRLKSSLLMILKSIHLMIKRQIKINSQQNDYATKTHREKCMERNAEKMR